MDFTVDQLCSDAGTESRIDCGNHGSEIIPLRVLSVLKGLGTYFCGEVLWPWQCAGVGFICSLSLSSVLFQIHFLRTLLIDLLEHHLEEREKNLLNANCVFPVIFLWRESSVSWAMCRLLLARGAGIKEEEHINLGLHRWNVYICVQSVYIFRHFKWLIFICRHNVLEYKCLFVCEFMSQIALCHAQL